MHESVIRAATSLASFLSFQQALNKLLAKPAKRVISSLNKIAPQQQGLQKEHERVPKQKLSTKHTCTSLIVFGLQDAGGFAPLSLSLFIC